MKKLILTLFVLVIAIPTFLLAEDGHDHDHATIKASHGGRIIEVGDEVAHLEWVHDPKTGKATIYVMDGKGKTLGLADAIRLNLPATKKTEKTQVVTRALNLKEGKASTFDAENAALKNEHLEGKISIKIKDKKYSANIPHDHDH